MPLDRTTVLGLREAQAAFRKLPQISREAFNEAVEKTASVIMSHAQSTLVPGHGFQTGALRRAVGFQLNRRSGSAKVGIRLGFEVFTPGRTGTAAGGHAHRPTKIGHLVEFGHSGPYPAKAHPFLVQAAERNKATFLNHCRAAGSTIERDMSRVGGRNL